jgi:hypothetical protein
MQELAVFVGSESLRGGGIVDIVTSFDRQVGAEPKDSCSGKSKMLYLEMLLT